MGDTDEENVFLRVFKFTVRKISELLESLAEGPLSPIRDVLMEYDGDDSRNIAILLLILVLVLIISRDLKTSQKFFVIKVTLGIIFVAVVALALKNTEEGASNSDRVTCEHCGEEFDTERALNIHKGHKHDN